MPKLLKRNAVVVCGLAGLFQWSFMFAKHDPGLRGVIPFSGDPYDTVGSFGTVVGILLAVLALARAFRPGRGAPPSTAQRVHLLRSQAAVAFAVLATLATDAVALARHPAMWIDAKSRDALIGLLVGLGVVTVAVLMLLRASRKELPGIGPPRWGRAAWAGALALVILAAYPEQLVRRTPTHLLTIAVAACLLFAPLRFLLTAFVPDAEAGARPGPSRRGPLRGALLHWGVVLLGGFMLGVIAVAGEMTEGGAAPPAGRLVYVAAVFIGAGMMGFAVAYAFLARPLGLQPSDRGGRNQGRIDSRE